VKVKKMTSFPMSFQDAKVLVVGDIMLDRYVWGKVKRISPEAPVPVVKVQRSTETLGGAGNVANNLVHLGCQTTVVGVCGEDAAARILKGLLEEKQIKAHLVVDPSRPTISKSRIMAQKQQIIRLDEEIIAVPGAEIMAQISALIEKEMPDAQAVIISDYGKGLFHEATFIRQIITKARQMGIAVLIDPKGRDWQRYENATCITPNTAELEAVAGVVLEDNEADLIRSARQIRRGLGIDYLLVTRGPKGMCLAGENKNPILIAAQAREVFDVSGAGDTVIATVAACLAAGLEMEEACRIANIAAGIVVGKLGTQPILYSELSSRVAFNRLQDQSPYSAVKLAAIDAAINRINQWKSEGATIVFTNGCFDLLHPGHISLLHQARTLGDRLIVGLNSDASVKRLKGNSRPILVEQDRAALLSALEHVDLVVSFDEDTPLSLIKTIQPDILVKGSDYTVDQVVGRDIVEAYGGQVKLVQIVPGYSTTLLSQKMKQ